MPDLVPNGDTGPQQIMDAARAETARYHRSRRLRLWLVTTAVLAAVLAGGAFAFSLFSNWQVTHHLVREDQVHQANLCRFLAHAIRDAPAEDKADARELAVAYQCPGTRHG